MKNSHNFIFILILLFFMMLTKSFAKEICTIDYLPLGYQLRSGEKIITKRLRDPYPIIKRRNELIKSGYCRNPLPSEIKPCFIGYYNNYSIIIPNSYILHNGKDLFLITGEISSAAKLRDALIDSGLCTREKLLPCRLKTFEKRGKYNVFRVLIGDRTISHDFTRMHDVSKFMVSAVRHGICEAPENKEELKKIIEALGNFPREINSERKRSPLYIFDGFKKRRGAKDSEIYLFRDKIGKPSFADDSEIYLFREDIGTPSSTHEK